jgi:hypothetical protein
MRNDYGEWNKEQQHGRQPEDDMGGSSLDSGAEKIGDHYKQDLSQNQIKKSEFAAESYAVGLNCGFGRPEGRVVCRSQVDGWNRRFKIPTRPSQKEQRQDGAQRDF